LMLVGAVALPNAILCVAPGGHFAIEIVNGGDCSEGLGGGLRAPHKRADGCPANCHDTRLASDIQCNHASPLMTPAVALIFTVPPTDALSLSGATGDRSSLAVRPPPRELRTTVILC